MAGSRRSKLARADAAGRTTRPIDGRNAAVTRQGGSPRSSAPQRARVRVAPKNSGSPVSRGIRWDRLPGNGMVAIVLVMALLYIPPVNSYIAQRKATTEQKAQLQQLGKENRALKKRAKSLRRSSTIELEARRLGMVKADERPYVILR